MSPRTDRRSLIVTRLRLATGLILFSFVLTHFLNHSLGLISLDVAELGRKLFVVVWRSPPGSVLLYGSLLIHFLLALWSLYRRRSLRMPRWEAAQLVFGLMIPPLLMAHMVGARGAFTVAGTDVSYPLVIYQLWIADPLNGVRQTGLFVVVWIHACIGLHFWLRVKPGYPRFATAAYTAAILIPTLALIGFAEASADVLRLTQQPGWFDAVRTAAHPPGPEDAAFIVAVRDALLDTYWVLLVGTLMARAARYLLVRRRAIAVSYPGGPRIAIHPGASILEASRMAEIPHASVCGGRGRCSTCRTRISQGLDSLPPPNEQEAAVLRRIGAPPNVRLACQTRPTADVAVMPLLPPVNGLREARRQHEFMQGHEREVAVLFADLRAFTRLSEKRLPYDVVFLLNRYFEAMGSAIEAAQGRLDKFIGDGVMAIFGIRRPVDDACSRALVAAAGMAANLARLNANLVEEGMEPLRIGIGIHAGPAIVGEMGYGRATSVTAIGDTVNTASRLEALAKEFGCQLVVSETVARHAGIEFPETARRAAQIRGRAAELAVYAVADAREVALPEVTPD